MNGDASRAIAVALARALAAAPRLDRDRFRAIANQVKAETGQKIVVCVYDHSPPNLNEYINATTSGLTEEVIPVAARDIGRSLPDSVIGYDAVDAIIWSDADPTKLAADQMSAIEQFVRRGGRLVISQDTATNQWQRNNVAFPLLMPVTVRGVEDRDDGLRTLREIARAPVSNPGVYVSPDDAWAKLKGPFRYASAEVKPGSTVVA